MTIDLWGKISRKNAPASDRTGLQEPLVGHWRDLPPRREGFPGSHSGAFLPRQHETFLRLSFTASFHPRHYLTFQLLVTARSSPLVTTRFFPSRHCEAFPFSSLRAFSLLVFARLSPSCYCEVFPFSLLRGFPLLVIARLSPSRHCEARSAEAIHGFDESIPVKNVLRAL